MAETTGTSTTRNSTKTAKSTASKTPAATATATSPSMRNAAESKAAASPGKAVRKSTSTTTISAEERQRLIAEAAYLRAEHRHFVGDPVTDWLEAEADVNASLAGPTH